MHFVTPEWKHGNQVTNEHSEDKQFINQYDSLMTDISCLSWPGVYILRRNDWNLGMAECIFSKPKQKSKNVGI